MKKKKQKAKTPQYLPFGMVINELVLWDFSNDDDLIRHNANELAKALQMSYNLSNFGPACFGINNEETGDE